MKIVLLKGWATPDDFYRDIFDFDFYIGFDSIDSREEITVISWSMGTIEALENINKYNIKKLILIAPTLKFCLTTKERVIDIMSKNLDRNKEKVLLKFSMDNFYNKFLANKYWECYKEKILNITTEELKLGLEYLKKSNLKIENINVETLIFTGCYDEIIPESNSKFIFDFFTNAKFIEFKRGHNLLYENYKFLEIVRSFVVDK